MSDCKNCKHLVMYDYKNKSYSCESRECEFDPVEQEPTTKNDLGVDLISRADAIGCLAGQIELSPSNVASVHEYLKCVNKRLHDLPSVTPQESFKPMVEIDLDYVIKQKYIEREVLDKIRAQIKSNLRGVEIALEVLAENHPLRQKMEGAKDTLEECLEIIDKAESER